MVCNNVNIREILKCSQAIQGSPRCSSLSVAAAGSLWQGMETRDTSDFTWGKLGSTTTISTGQPPPQVLLKRSDLFPGCASRLYVAAHVARASGKDNNKKKKKKKKKRSPHESRILTNTNRLWRERPPHSATSRSEETSVLTRFTHGHTA